MWLTTWPLDGRPNFREHPTEQAAEQDAANLRMRGHVSAMVFWSEITSVLDVEVGDVA